ncbi:phosphonopyruvate decarboxylase [Pectobacterium sp. CHL-2024]|uniref:phosphonopyruvate decarboxylase n=1 Tax=Pectobacterium sp. CHL-2024 TaxID=3377079 RepID=UPI003808AB32
MIDPNKLIEFLVQRGVHFFSGVPDSLLKAFCLAIGSNNGGLAHRIASNEGCAVGMAMGHYLSTRTLPVVYMQNSGLGNAINPLCSLATPDVYGIPLLLIIGWRGEVDESGKQLHDEPQHVMQGRVTLPQLNVLDIPHIVLDGHNTPPWDDIQALLQRAHDEHRPVALVVRKNTFSSPAASANPTAESALMRREAIVAACLNVLPSHLPIVSTTGMLSRELYELREQRGEGHQRDFLTVGGMGLASQIALGLCDAQPQRKVVCLDGDGALLMHMGGLTNTAQASNLIHIVINNGAHDSVGGQPTAASRLPLAPIAAASGYGATYYAETEEALQAALQQALQAQCSQFIEVQCRVGHRSDLGRPATSPAQNRDAFMQFLNTPPQLS